VKKLKDVGIDYVEISIDGATSKVHERFRGVPGCFKKTMDGIQNCTKEGLHTCIASTAHKENYFEIFKIMGLAKRLCVRFIHFNYVLYRKSKKSS
jgi:MoaA/NifB/PqqE/SkfB family radical SAM enzyme